MDKIFGVAEKALQVTEERALLISNNIVNSNTPHYKAKDIDFSQVMRNLNRTSSLETSHPNHIQSSNNVLGTSIQYRIPMQKSLDGNTVDPEIERKNFLENSIRYQVSLTFIKGKADELVKAMKGE